MRPGTTIGGWTLTNALDEKRRLWLAQDSAGEQAALLIAEADQAARLAAWVHASGEAGDPSLPAPYPADDAKSAWVLPNLEQRLPQELAGPEAPAIVAAIGAALFGPLLATGHLMKEGFQPDLLAFDVGGALRLLPLDPGERSPVAVAPELRDGGSPTRNSALYGLGAWLYRLATGRPPVENPGRPGPPPPPSTLRPDLPPALDTAIVALMSWDPVAREEALALLHDVAGPLPDLRRLLPRRTPSTAAATPAPIRYTTTPASRPQQARVDAPAGVLQAIDPAEAAALTPAQRSEVAGRLGLPMSEVQRLIGAGGDIPVAAGLPRDRTQAEAEAHALPGRLLQAPSVTRPVAALALGAGGLATAGIGAVVTALTLGLGLPLLGLGLIGVVGAAWLAAGWWRDRAAYAQTSETWAQTQRRSAQALAHPLVGTARARLVRLRRAVAEDHLPAVAASDVRSGLNEVDTDLDVLARAFDSATETDRARLEADRDAIESALAELEALLGSAAQQSTTGVGSALEGLLSAAQHAVDAVADDNPVERARRAGAARNLQ